jgi:hypothetical protein
MELIHIANATFSSSRIKSNQLISLENLASKTKLTGLLKSTRRAQGAPRRKLVCYVQVGPGSGGASRDRTGDLLVANQTLSQLSYGPVLNQGWWVWEELHLRPHPYQGCALTN